jgi:Sulfatase
MQRGFTDYYGFLQGARSYFPLRKPNQLNQLLRDHEPVVESFDYMTDELGRAAADYIAKSKDKPFFIYLAYNATHGPNEAMAAAGIQTSPGNLLDGVNLIPYMLDPSKGRPHQTLYWKNGTKWAVRNGDLKAVFGNPQGQGKRTATSTEIALFDLSKDGSETNDLAASRADDVARLKQLYIEWKKDFPTPTWGGGGKKN